MSVALPTDQMFKVCTAFAIGFQAAAVFRRYK
jgi:hypothetical protein